MSIMTLNTYSQTIILNEKKDTTICFNKSESKFLLKNYYDLKHCDSLRIIVESQFNTCTTLSKKKDEMFNEMNMYYENCNSQNRLKDLRIQGLSNDLTKCQKETKAQILYKKIFFVISVASTSALLYSLFILR